MTWRDWEMCDESDYKMGIGQVNRGYTAQEKDPNGLALKTPGSKADEGKSPVMQGALQYFPRAIVEVASVSEVGAKKYSWRGWESVPNGVQRYGDALVRHLIYETIDGETDADTGLLHAAQVAWNALARLELILRMKQCERQRLDCAVLGSKPGEWKEITPEQAKVLGLGTCRT